jgi:Tfp pilus assembly protein PilF
MAHVWHGLVLTTQGRYREAAARNREALRLDPLSPIANTNAGFDALRFGEENEAAARFAVAIEIDPGFAVPYSGMAKLDATRGALRDAAQRAL